MSIGMKVII